MSNLVRLHEWWSLMIFTSRNIDPSCDRLSFVCYFEFNVNTDRILTRDLFNNVPGSYLFRKPSHALKILLLIALSKAVDPMALTTTGPYQKCCSP